MKGKLRVPSFTKLLAIGVICHASVQECFLASRRYIRCNRGNGIRRSTARRRGQWCHNGPAGTALSGGSDAVPKPLATIRHNFRGSTRDCGSDGYPPPPGGSYCDQPDANGAIGPHYFVELVNNHYAVYTKQASVVQMTGGEFWVRPASRSGSTTLRSIPPSSSIPPRVDGMQLLSTPYPTASRGVKGRPANRRLPGRRPTEGFIGFKIQTSQCEGRGR